MNISIKVFFFSFCLIITSPVFAQRFNTDAVNKFWQLADHLEKDQPLTDTLWNTYYNLYGNKQYIDHNRDSVQATEHRNYLDLVFRPSKAAELAALLKSNNQPDDDILKNLLYIKSHEKALRTYTGQITSSVYLKDCIALAKTWLPKGKYNKIPKNLIIYINAMTFDAAVQSPDMYFGLSIVYEFDLFKKGAIAAHELHHQLRVSKLLQRKVSYADSTSLSIVNQINNEGMADLIDKRIVVANFKTLYDAEGTFGCIVATSPCFKW